VPSPHCGYGDHFEAKKDNAIKAAAAQSEGNECREVVDVGRTLCGLFFI